MQDERPIEKLLRRYAKKRRGDARSPVELHPATRRLLQGEVARQFRKDPPGAAQFSFAQIRQSWRLQLAWAVPLLVMVAVGLWSLLDRPAPKQLALGPATNQAKPQTVTESLARLEQADARPDAAPTIVAETTPVESSAAKALPPPPASVPTRSLNQLTPSLADNRAAGENRRAAPASAYVTTTNQPVTPLVGAAEPKGVAANYDAKGTVQTDKLGGVASAAPARARFAEAANVNRLNIVPANLAPESDATRQSSRNLIGPAEAKVSGNAAPLLDAPKASVKLADRDNLEREQAQTYSQAFANVSPEALKQKAVKADAPSPISPVLANFRVEQTGRQLRVVDGDGSTYVGETDSTPLSRADDGGKKEQVVQLFKNDGKLGQLPAAGATSSLQPQAQNNFYRVAGTNRTLNQSVVFTWSYLEMTNAPVLAQSGKISGDLNKDAQKLPAQFPALLQNSFINGRAQFETGKEIEINAVPVSP